MASKESSRSLWDRRIALTLSRATRSGGQLSIQPECLAKLALSLRFVVLLSSNLLL